MGLLVVLAVAALGAVLGTGVVLAVRSTSPRDGEVMPAHYGSLLQYDRARYPGLCQSCGTDNEPGYEFCEECGSAIQSADHAPADVDVRWIVEP